MGVGFGLVLLLGFSPKSNSLSNLPGIIYAKDEISYTRAVNLLFIDGEPAIMDEEGRPYFVVEDADKWAEIERYRADIEKQKVETYAAVAEKIIDSYKEYSWKGRRSLTLMTGALITAIFVAMAVLTYCGKVGGETFAFVTGTIIGYIISLLKQG